MRWRSWGLVGCRKLPEIEAAYLPCGIQADSHDVRRLLELNPIDIGTQRPNSPERDGLQLTSTDELLMGIGPVGLERRGNYRIDVVIIRLIRLERVDVLAERRFTPGGHFLLAHPQR